MGAASRRHEFINRSVAAFAAVDQQGIEALFSLTAHWRQLSRSC